MLTDIFGQAHASAASSPAPVFPAICPRIAQHQGLEYSAAPCQGFQTGPHELENCWRELQ